MKKAVDKGNWNDGAYPEKSYTLICCCYRPWSHFITFSLDFRPTSALLVLRAGHGMILMLCCTRESLVALAVWARALSCWRIDIGGQAATDGVGIDGSLLCSNGMTSCLSCCGESVLQMYVGAEISDLVVVW